MTGDMRGESIVSRHKHHNLYDDDGRRCRAEGASCSSRKRCCEGFECDMTQRRNRGRCVESGPTPITDDNFRDAIAACLVDPNEVDGMCSTSEYGAMPDWNVALVTNMLGAFIGRAVHVDPRLNPG